MAFAVRKRTAYGCLGCSAVAGGAFAIVMGVGGVGAVFFPGWAWQQSVRAALAGMTGGEADFASVSLREDGAEVRGLTVTHPGGTRVLYVDRVDIHCDPSTLTTDDWHLTEVVLQGVALRIDEEGDGLALPPSTWDLVWGDGPSEDAPRVAIDVLRVSDVAFEGHGRAGVLAGSFATATVNEVVLEAGAERPVRLRDAVLEGLVSTVDGRELADVGRVALGEDGVFAATDVEASAALQASGWPVWPPLVELWIPTWAGGRAAPGQGGDAPWWGWQPATWPWVPDRGSAAGRVVLTDRFMASRPATWVLSNTKLAIGPVDGDLPWTASTYTAGAPVYARGKVTPGGVITGHVSGKGMQARDFDPYLAVNLHSFGVEIREGTLDAEVDLWMQGSKVRAGGPVSLYNVRFNRTSAFSGLNKALLSTASWLVGGKDKTFATEVEVSGSFTDPKFSPFKQLFGQVSAAIVKDAGDRVGQGATTVKDTAGKLWNKVFK
ncbi:MAG: DUF748 domain-containing protein [Alphaproteobacteria bacterium]|nr:DUF748 domain-containing protein [Alphaproteobacteria bacterium]